MSTIDQMVNIKDHEERTIKGVLKRHKNLKDQTFRVALEVINRFKQEISNQRYMLEKNAETIIFSTEVFNNLLDSINGKPFFKKFKNFFKRNLDLNQLNMGKSNFFQFSQIKISVEKYLYIIIYNF